MYFLLLNIFFLFQFTFLKKINLFIPSFSFYIPSVTCVGVPTDDADLTVTWKTTFSILDSVDNFLFPCILLSLC